MSYIASFILFLWGWKVEGSPHKEVKKKLYAIMPHTSNWDYPVALLFKIKLKLKLNYLGKAALFKPPLVWIMKPTGGVAVDRTKSNKLVDQIVDLYDSHEKFALALTPEGTRKKVGSLKKGFYYIAVGAKVPIVFVSLDFKRKVLAFRELYHPSGDYENDMREVLPFYKGVEGKREKDNALRELAF